MAKFELHEMVVNHALSIANLSLNVEDNLTKPMSSR